MKTTQRNVASLNCAKQKLFSIHSVPFWICLTLFLFFSESYSAQENQYELMLINGSVTPQPVSSVFSELEVGENEQNEENYYRIIQFYNIPTEEEKDALKRGGIELLQYVPNFAYFAMIRPNYSRSAILAGSTIRSISPIIAEYKLHPSVRTAEFESLDSYDLVITCFQGIEIESIIEKISAVIPKVEFLRSDNRSNIIRVLVPSGSLNMLTSLTFVQFIEQYDEAELENNSGTTLHASNLLNSNLSSGLHYDGTGVGVSVGDEPYFFTHLDFHGRYSGITGTAYHATHVAGTIGGAGNLNPKYKGQAPGVHMVSYNLWSDIDNLDTIASLYNGINRIRVTNHSLRENMNAGYTSTARMSDLAVDLLPSLINVHSAGNAGSGWFSITGGYKAAKNSIATGNLNYQDQIELSSSRGPSADGRIKPDICAKGTNVTSSIPYNSYDTYTGTSMASPGVSGCVAQLIHAYRDLNSGVDPKLALLKSILLNTAYDLGNVGPDYTFGWGRINNWRAYQTIKTGRYLSANISNGMSQSHSIPVPANVKELKVMVYWADPAAAAGVSRALINDLDIVLTNGNQTYSPWLLNKNSPSSNATRGIDRDNNMEQVSVTNPASGTYTLTVTGFLVPQGPQEYWLTYEYITDSIKLTYPNGGENLVPGETEYIRWDAGASNASFAISYSIDGGAAWVSLSNTVSSTSRYYQWTVPSNITGNALFKVSRNGFEDQSDTTFSIMTVPGSISTVWRCPDSLKISWVGVSAATSYEVYLLGEKYMESQGTTTNSNFVIQTPSSNVAWVGVRAIGANGLVPGRRTISVSIPVGTTNCPAPPTVQFSSPSTNYYCSAYVSFTNQSMSTGTTSWLWNFGDGFTSTSMSPSHNYASSGTYTVSLIATNSYGSDTLIRNNYIIVLLNAAPVTPALNAASAIGETSFSATWNPVGGATTYFLDVAFDSTFSNFVSGYNNLSLYSASKTVSALYCDSTYYFRVRASNNCGMSTYSAIRQVRTSTCMCYTCPMYNFSITPSSVWQTHSSSHLSYGCKIYAVSVVQGDLYTFKTGCGDGATASYDTYLELKNTNCSSLAYNDDGCSSPTYSSLLNYEATYSGIIYLKVRGYSSRSGSYTLAYIHSPCNNNLSITANAASWISPTGFTANWTSSPGAVSYLLDVATDSLFTNFVSGYSNRNMGLYTSISLSNLPCNTTYYYRVRAANSCDTSAYSVTIRTATSVCVCTLCPNSDFSISPNATWQLHSSSHVMYGCKMYAFPVLNGRTYVFKTGCGDGASANYDTYLELFNSSCVSLRTNDDGCSGLSSIITWTANFSGTAYLKVRGFSSYYGSYTLAYQEQYCDRNIAPDLLPTTQLTNNGFVVNWPSYFGASTYYLDVAYDSAFISFVTGYSNLNVGNVLSYSIASLQCERNYYYRIRAVLTCGTTINSRIVHVLTGPCSPPACPNYDFLINPQLSWQTHSSATYLGINRIYAIPVHSGDSYLFKTGCGDGATANFDTYFELLDSNCTIIAYNDDGCASPVGSSFLNWTAPYSGKLFLRIKSFNAAYGNYTLAYRTNPCYVNVSQNLSICSGQQINVGSHIYLASGTYRDTIPVFDGCDTLLTTLLTVSTNLSSSVSVLACESYTAPDGQIYDSTGVYTLVIPSFIGCDSTITLDLTINRTSFANQIISACDSYTAQDGQVYISSGVYTIIIPNALGCDSTITLDLTINRTNYVNQIISACDSYIGPDGQVYVSSGIYTIIIPNAFGCDSTITLNLTIIRTSYVNQIISACDSYTAQDGQVYTSSGIYTVVVPNALACDSIITLDLTINQASFVNQIISACDSYTAQDGQVYTSSGIYTIIIPNALGCDSTITLDLTINQSSFANQIISACDSYTAQDGQVYTSSGIYTIIIPNALGCDSTITLDLTINRTSFANQIISACDSYIAQDGQIYTSSGIYTIVIPNVLGCDSTITLDLTVNHSSVSNQNLSACEFYTAPDGQVYSASGIYTFVIPSALGCDSTIVLNLSIKHASMGQLSVSSCGFYTAPNGVVYGTSGTYLAIIPNAAGCDSLLTIILQIVPPSTSFIVVSACNSYVAPDGRVYFASGTYYATIPNAAGCDSLIAINLSILPSSASSITVSSCGSYTAPDGQVYTSSGDYFATIPNARGCDSTILIFLSIHSSSFSSFSQSACGTYTAPDGQVYSSSGVYTVRIPNAMGCDSIITINLSILQPSSNTISVSSCDVYTAPDGQVYNSSGNYTATILNAAGCDSVIAIALSITSLNLTINVQNNIIAAQNSGAQYQWLNCDDDMSPISGANQQFYEVLTGGNYAVKITENGCTDTSICVNVILSGLENTPLFGETTVLPNPSSGTFQIDFGNQIPEEIAVLDLSGRKIIRQKTNGTQKILLDLNSEASGMYLLYLYHPKGRSQIVKLLKE